MNGCGRAAQRRAEEAVTSAFLQAMAELGVPVPDLGALDGGE